MGAKTWRQKKCMTTKTTKTSRSILSIRQRMLLLICTLLLCVIVTFAIAAYYGIRNAEMAMGRERLSSVSNELSSMLSASTTTLVKTTKITADNDTIRKYIQLGGAQLHDDASKILKETWKDSTNTMIELVDVHFSSLLSYSIESEKLKSKLSHSLKSSDRSLPDNSGEVGKILTIDSLMYCPVVIPVTDKEKAIGYLVSWRLISGPPSATEQVSQLIGKGAAFYIGNSDGSLWTNLTKPVTKPTAESIEVNKEIEYTDSKGQSVIAKAQPITSSSWLVLVEFSKHTIAEGANRFLRWIIFIGLLLIAAGIVIARIVSYSITRPLQQLTDAATAISKGDYSSTVELDRNDELSKLATAFNIMAGEIKVMRSDLEDKVTGRTAQLEALHNEMEAFSYTVSHDLRAPLRGIIGFTAILEEKYSSQLDDEAKRLTGIIKKNTLKMGNLIDDLLAFSKIGRNELVKHNIPTNEIVKEVIESLDPKHLNDKIKWNITALPDVTGDTNAIRQVWTNYISNAIKYSARKEQPVIEIGSWVHEGQTAFFVKDNGVGFDEQYKDKLFKVFQRLHSMAEFEGTGIGLAIVEKIISKHGGHVWVEAKEGEGAVFYFSLPVA